MFGGAVANLHARGLGLNDPGNWAVQWPSDSAPGAPAGSSGGHSTRDLILGTINNLTPQFLQAFGKNPISVGGYNYGGVVTQAGYAANQAPASQISQGVGTGIANSLQGIGNFFGASPTTVILGGAAALFLLFRQPPRRR